MDIIIRCLPARIPTVKKQFGPWAAGISLLLMLGVFSILVLGGNFTSEYAIPLQFACFTLASGLREDRTDLLRAFGIGALCACLFLLKQNLIGIPAVIIAFRMVSLWRKNQKRSILPEAGGVALGILLVILPVFGYFAIHSALADMWDAAFRFNVYYAETGFASSLKSLIHGLEAVSQVGFGILGLAGWLAGIWLLIRNAGIFRKHNAWLAAALVALPVEFFLEVLPGRFEEHYFLSVLPVLCIFTALALWGLFRNLIPRVVSPDSLYRSRTSYRGPIFNIGQGHLYTDRIVPDQRLVGCCGVYRVT